MESEKRHGKNPCAVFFGVKKEKVDSKQSGWNIRLKNVHGVI
jgi:hypothetical protein